MRSGRKVATVRAGRTRDKAATKARLLEVAERGFAARGFEGVALDDIASEAGVRKATLLYHFESKDVLYAAVAEAVARRFMPLALVFSRPLSADALDDAVRVLHDVTAEHRHAAVLLMREALDERGEVANDLVGPFVANAEAWIRHGQTAGVLDDELPARSVVTLIVGAVTLPFLNPRLFPPDREAAVTFVRRALESRRKKR